MHHFNFFPSTLNALITEYANEDITARYDLLLMSEQVKVEPIEVIELMQKAKKNGTPILSCEYIELSERTRTKVFTIYGDYDGNGNWETNIICSSPSDEFDYLNGLPFNEKILKKDDIRFTDYLMEILKKGHIPSIDYTSPSLGRYCG